MPKIDDVVKLTDLKYVNLYEIHGKNKNGEDINYYFASRHDKDNVQPFKKEVKADAVAVFAYYGEDMEKVVLIRQYRYPIGDYVYEFPAGLIDKGETVEQAAVREFKEETGLDLTILPADDIFSKPRFSATGLTDESLSIVKGIASGSVSYEGLEAMEDLSVVLADRNEVRRILIEEKVAARCALLLERFLTR
jgi:ADP-ribose pyrophosphatase